MSHSENPHCDLGSLLCPSICATAWFPRRTGLSGSAGSSVAMPRAGKWVQTATKLLFWGPGASQGALFSLWVTHSCGLGIEPALWDQLWVLSTSLGQSLGFVTFEMGAWRALESLTWEATCSSQCSL